ncbi:hypothetical protein TanjilG_05200 [Lupinus angustifolius]|uniref:Small ribosomal subunit protein mS38 n=1 Tax=Lupinus angustifolius TaxID=3871 RepID=A0A4P1RAT1_LUPAN|nr:PREDICTED: uncharacterized protein LOC109353530 [Lupinus angustifolius]OIW06429.1 hypothetical protein TanjilG_05200 [Lupinus angustifolius]
MASALQKLVRKLPSTPTRFITSLHPSSQPPNPFNPIIHLHPESHSLIPPTETPDQSNASTIIFPSFPFGFSSKPIFDSGFCSPEVKEEGLEDSRTIWADSVKKKRKKKMNKHKYQKLRKRMRRQT